MVRGSEGVKRIVPALVMALLAALILSGCRASTAPETPSAARRLSCVQPSSLTGLCPAGGAKVAMCRTDESGAITTVELIDIDADSVAAETELEGEWTVQQQSFCDKRIALCDREHNMWQLLSPDLADLGTVKVETCDGYFSYDAKSYYFLRDDDAQELIKSPAIKKKLQHMSSAVRSVFDTSGWESVRWERLL